MSTSVIARCSAGHEWPSTRSESWQIVPPRRNKTRVSTLGTPHCPQCGGVHVSFTDAQHLPALPAVPRAPAAVEPVFVRVRCELGHEWPSTAPTPKTLTDPSCPNCGRPAASFTSTRHG